MDIGGDFNRLAVGCGKASGHPGAGGLRLRNGFERVRRDETARGRERGSARDREFLRNPRRSILSDLRNAFR